MSSKKVTEIIKLIKSDFKSAKDLTVEELVKVLKKLADVYYNTGKSLVSDEIFDDLKDLLKKKDKHNPYLEEVGAPVRGTKNKVKLPYEMGSLNKIKADKDTDLLNKWLKKYSGPYVVSDKLDGASVQLYKNKDGDVFLYSRGKSKVGQDISHLIPYVVSKQCVTNLPNNTSVRGELIITKKDFTKISDYMKNARNAVAGLINSKTVDMKVAKISKMICYSVLHPKYLLSDQIKLLEKWKFDVAYYKIVKELDEDTLKKYLINRKNESVYDIDGIVCADNSKIYEQTGGYPDHMIAFKMLLEDQIVTTTVEEIIWNASKNGYLKPKIRIKPVELNGTTVTYATAFNAKYIVDNVLGKGAKIRIVKSGDVIPYIVEVVSGSKSGKPDLPDDKYEWNDTNVDLVLKNISDSEDVTIKLLVYFFSTMGIKYLSEGIITKLVDEGYDSIIKILKADKDDLANIDGLGDKIVDKIYKEINRAFNEVDLATFMAASHKFGRGFGVKKLEEIVKVYPDILTVKWKYDKLIQKIEEVDGFSEKLSTMFADNFNDFKDFYKDISKIKDISRFEEIEETDSESELESKIFDGFTIVMTGFRDSDLEKLIKNLGGKVSTSVSKNTNILIHKDDAEITSSKFKKAEELGTKIMSKSEFIKKYKLKIK